ncbi:MAG TPA: hypothetical protein VGS27_20740 [Candidatus Sulfotelmatobacter sp.]|nr:hypothetical protein [Candidatus Sulfotelmatobacter sp.]
MRKAKLSRAGCREAAAIGPVYEPGLSSLLLLVPELLGVSQHAEFLLRAFQ